MANPDEICLPADLPKWQKDLLDERIASIELNPELILSGEDLFDGL